MSKKAKKKSAVRVVERQKAGGRVERNAADGKEITGVPAESTVNRSMDFEHKYDYIKSDLMQIGVISITLVAILILLSVFIKV